MGQPVPGDAGTPRAEHIGTVEGTGGTETSQYPEEERTIPGVAASERGRAQTRSVAQAAADAGRG
jgi:hypothetical protein